MYIYTRSQQHGFLVIKATDAKMASIPEQPTSLRVERVGRARPHQNGGLCSRSENWELV